MRAVGAVVFANRAPGRSLRYGPQRFQCSSRRRDASSRRSSLFMHLCNAGATLGYSRDETIQTARYSLSTTHFTEEACFSFQASPNNF